MRSGFVVLAGRSNVGKSTLLNALAGTKLAITSPKPQTTRHPIHGAVTRPEGQAVFVDTPGVFLKRRDALTASLNRAVQESLKDIDLVLYVVDPTRAIGPEEERVMKLVKGSGVPALLVINKIDQYAPFLEDYRALADDFDGSVEVSALRGTHVQTLIDEAISRLPEGKPIYPPDRLSNVDDRFWLAELVREKAFLVLRQELPYAVTVEVDEIGARKKEKTGEDVTYVRARILCDTDAHKRMIIGAGGRTVKRIGSMARRELEAVSGRKVFLDLSVETDPHWPERLP